MNAKGAKCRKCGMPIRFVINERSPQRRRIPVDATPTTAATS